MKPERLWIILSRLILTTDHNMKQLILGGARSGKSSLAENLALKSGKAVTYIATANRQYNDSEMDARIQHHCERRPPQWRTVETPVELATTIEKLDGTDQCLLVDCLTLWLSNCLYELGEDHWQKQRSDLLATLPELQADILLIGNELGSGLIPLGPENRRFVDENGFLHQSLATLCDRVILTAAGLPLVLKGEPL